MLETLLRRGANANAEDAKGATPLHEAVKRRREGMARKLVEAGADIHRVAEAG